MSAFEDMLMGDRTPTPTPQQLPGAAAFFLSLKENVKSAAALPGPTGAPSQVGRSVSKLRAIGSRTPSPSAMAQSKTRGAVQAAGGKPVNRQRVDKPGAPKVASAMTDGLAAFGAGATAAAPTGLRGLLAKIPIERLRRAVKDPEALARARGTEYFNSWRQGRDLRRAVDPNEIVPSLNSAMRNKDGSMTLGSAVAGLNDSGALPTHKMVEGAQVGAAYTKKVLEQRAKAKRLKQGLIASGVVAGGGGLGYALSRRRKGPAQDPSREA